MNLKTSGEDLLTNLAAIKDEGEYFLLTVPLSLGPKSGLYLITYYQPSTIRETVASKQRRKDCSTCLSCLSRAVAGARLRLVGRHCGCGAALLLRDDGQARPLVREDSSPLPSETKFFICDLLQCGR